MLAPHLTKATSWSALGRECGALLWRRKKLALSVFLLLVVAGLTALALVPRSYESSLKILLTDNREEARKLTPETVQTEIALLQSRTVLERTCQTLGFTASESEAAAAQLTVAPQAQLLHVAYRAATPEKATRFLQTLFQQYAAYRRELQPQARLEATLRERAAALNQSLDQATHSLEQFDGQHGSLALSEQQTLLLRQLADTQAQADAARIEKQGLEQQIQTLRVQLSAQPEQLETQSITKYAQALDKLKEEHAALALQHTQLLQKYQPNHRLVRDLEQRLAQVQEMITREEQHPPREQTFALNETRQRITNDLFAAEAKLAALAPREQRLTQLASEYQTRLTELTAQGVKKSELERTRALNEDAYLLYQKKAQEAGLDAVLQQNKGVQISLAEAPRVGSIPNNTNGPRNVAGILMLGMLTATGSVLAAESLRPRVRTAEALRRQFGLSVLAKLPASSQRN